MPIAPRVATVLLVCAAGLAGPGCSPEPPSAAVASAVAVDADALAEQGRTYMTGALGLPRDPAKARELFEAAAQKGSGPGLFYLGLAAYEGGRASDLKEACGLFAQSAGRGHAGALREHGECLARGTGGTPTDPAAAAEAFRKSIALGGVEAYVSLARLYERGDGVTKDREEAAGLMRKHREALAGQ